MHLIAKRSTWTHSIYLTSWGHLKKMMSDYWSWSYHQSHGIESYGNDYSHMNADNCTPLWKVAKKMKWSNGKFECTIKFVVSNSAKSTIKFLNSEKVKIWGLRNLLDFPWIPQRFPPLGHLKICCLDQNFDYVIRFVSLRGVRST